MDRLDIVVASVDTERRLISGIVAPHGEAAEVSNWPTAMRIAPGALRAARERTPLLLGHDLDRPVGILAGLEEAEGATRASFRVDRTPDGDAALAQARSGSRGGLSLGMEIDRFTDTDGVTTVEEASIYEVSLVSVAAFAGAVVERVAAQRANGEEEQVTDEQQETTEAEETEEERREREERERREAETNGEQEERVETVEATRAVPMVRAERSSRPRIRAGELVQHMVRAEKGNAASQRLVQAALVAHDTSDIPGLLPPAYTTDLLGTIDSDRSLADTFRSASPLPANGMAITKPKWTTLPNGSWVIDGQATPSNAIAIGSQEAAVEQWAFGILVSYAALERSTPDFGEAIFREAVADYYADVELKIHDELIAAMGALSATLGEAVAKYIAARHERPNVILMSGDVYGDYIDATGPGYPLYTTGNIDASGNVNEYIAGLKIVLAPYLNAGTMLVTHTSVIDFRETSPVRVSAQVIGVNSVELGVYNFSLFDTDKPGAVFPVGAALPTAVGNLDDGRAALYVEGPNPATLESGDRVAVEQKSRSGSKSA